MQETIPERIHLLPCKCPNIKIDINGITTLALIDSGSEVTAISEEFFELHEKLKNCPKLPLNGKIVKGALGTKSTIVKFQILCLVKVGEITEEIIFLIIPKLGKNCILGYDTIKDMSMIIYSNEEIINFKKAGIPLKMVQPENQKTNENCNSHLLSIKCIESDQFLFKNKENDILPYLEESSISREEIDKKLEDNKNLSNIEKNKLADLIWNHRKAFEKKPGLITNFEYDLVGENDEPFFVKPYPIPLKHQEKVEEEIQVMLKKWHYSQVKK